MNKTTWFKLYRGWQDNPMFRSDKDKLNWLWLIENAVIDEVTVAVNNKPVKVTRGQLCYSISFLAKAWGATPSYVRCFLKHLKSWQAIDTQNDKGQTLVTICNYCKYQDKGSQNDKATTQITASLRQGYDNNTKNAKKGKNIYTPEFDVFWEMYPRQRRGDKTKSFRAYTRALEKDSAENILKGLKSYCSSTEVSEGYAKGCEAWLNDSRWLNNYNPTGHNQSQFSSEKIVLW